MLYIYIYITSAYIKNDESLHSQKFLCTRIQILENIDSQNIHPDVLCKINK